MNTKSINSIRSPVPPFTFESAMEKVRLAENAWNSRNPELVSLAYTPDSAWRNRSSFINGRDEIVSFLKAKWEKEIEYRLVKELWAYYGSKISVKFQYEWVNKDGFWFRSYGNENWEFDEFGFMKRREASINDVEIKFSERKFLWDASGIRPLEHPGILD